MPSSNLDNLRQEFEKHADADFYSAIICLSGSGRERDILLDRAAKCIAGGPYRPTNSRPLTIRRRDTATPECYDGILAIYGSACETTELTMNSPKGRFNDLAGRTLRELTELKLLVEADFTLPEQEESTTMSWLWIVHQVAMSSRCTRLVSRPGEVYVSDIVRYTGTGQSQVVLQSVGVRDDYLGSPLVDDCESPMEFIDRLGSAHSSDDEQLVELQQQAEARHKIVSQSQMVGILGTDVFRASALALEHLQGPPPLTEPEAAVLQLIKEVEPGGGIGEKEIAAKLELQGVALGAGSVRTHIIPKLKEWYGVQNRKTVGYYIPRSWRWV